MNRPRVLHIGKYVPPPYAGIEAHIDLLLRCIQPYVDCCLLAANSPLSGANEQLCYSLRTVASWGKLNSVYISPGILLQAQRLFARGEVDLLHIHAPNPWGDLAALIAPASIPVVMTWHSDIVRQRFIYKGYRYIQQAAVRRADKIIIPTAQHLKSSHQLPPSLVSSKVRIIPFGIDQQALAIQYADQRFMEDIRSWASGRPLILTVGRHVYYKGYSYLLQAVAGMRQDAALLMIGQGPLTDTLHQMIGELGLQSKVKILAQQPRARLIAAFHSCDIFTLPSVEPSEAFGLAAAEAMACGKPVVACQLDNGVEFLHRQGQTSLLVPPRQPQALAEALDALCADPERRQQMGVAARERIERLFSLDAMRQGTLKVYRELLPMDYGDDGEQSRTPSQSAARNDPK